MPDLKKMLTLEALSEALPSWLKRSTKPEYNADEIDSTLTTNQFVTASDKENWNAKGTYSKPNDGIPKSDLSSLVQTSLGKADTALQTETDPTVPAWAKQSSKPSYTQDEVPDGSTYKRVNQTEKDTWSGKQNALTTTQMSAVNSGITTAGVTQISTNQTNVLYTMQMVGKNILNYDAWKTVGINGGTAVWENNGVTLTATSSDCYTYYAPSGSFPDDAKISVNEGDKIVLSWEFERASSSITGSVLIFPNGNVSGSTNTSVTTKSLEYTVPSGVSFLTFRFGVNSGSGSVLKYKDIMICYKNVADVLGTAYELPSKPSSDLTRLESEDRAGLVDVVDSGAKNIAEIYNVTQNAITITTSGYKATFSGSASQDGSIYWGRFHADKTGDYILYFNMSTSAGRFTVYNETDREIIKSCYPTDNLTPIAINLVAGKSYSIYSWFAAGTASACVIDFMICTLADWKVSQKFVPYRKNLDQLDSTKAPALSTTRIESGSINDIKTNSFILCTANVTDRPINSWGFLRTSVFNSETALQEFIALDSVDADAGKTFVRVMQAGNWKSWKALANA